MDVRKMGSNVTVDVSAMGIVTVISKLQFSLVNC